MPDNKEAGSDSLILHTLPVFTQEVNDGVSVLISLCITDISPNIGGSQNVMGVNRSFSLKLEDQLWMFNLKNLGGSRTNYGMTTWPGEISPEEELSIGNNYTLTSIT
ncbi:hypothetical protein Tco_1476463 [Tanacetum coccineum]